MTTHSLVWAKHSDSLPNSIVWKGSQTSNFTVEKSEKYYLSQVIKININMVSHVANMYLSYGVMRMRFYLYVLPP